MKTTKTITLVQPKQAKSGKNFTKGRFFIAANKGRLAIWRVTGRIEDAIYTESIGYLIAPEKYVDIVRGVVTAEVIPIKADDSDYQHKKYGKIQIALLSKMRDKVTSFPIIRLLQAPSM